MLLGWVLLHVHRNPLPLTRAAWESGTAVPFSAVRHDEQFSVNLTVLEVFLLS